MSASRPTARCLRSALSLLALVGLGAAGCSSTEELDGPLTGLVDDDAASDGGESSGGASDDDAGGSDSGEDASDPEPPAEPDDGGHAVPASEPSTTCNADDDVALWILPNDSNATTSPVRAREAVLGGFGTVQPVAIRTWEFFNYYDFGYPAAAPGSLAIGAALLEPADAPAGELVVQVGVSSETITAETRAPLSVTLVLDTSGSMEGPAIAMLKETCYALASSLQEGDVISMVTWSTEHAVLLASHEVKGPDDPVLLASIDALAASGVSDLHAGLEAGYALAQQSATSAHESRVVLVSDGGAAADASDLALIAQHSEDGIDLVGVGVGDAATYRDDLMDTVTAAGKGATVFIADADEAWATFHDRFIATMTVAARNVQLHLDLPPGFEIVDPGADEATVDTAGIEPQHLAPNDAMVFHQRIRTCAPQLVTDDAPITITVIWIDPATSLPRQIQRKSTVAELVAADQAPLYKGAAVLAYAESLKAYKQADAEGRESTMTGALGALAQAEALLPADPELAEIRQVLETLAQ